MTPGAGTAQSVGRVGRRQMWRVAAGSWFCCGRFVVLRRSSGRHKWRPYVWGRLNVVLRWPFCGFASVVRASQVAPLRLRRLTVVLCRPVRGVARRAPFMTPGAGTAQSVGRVGHRHMWRVAAGLRFCCGRFVVLRRSSRRHEWRPCVCGAVECCFVSAGSRRSP